MQNYILFAAVCEAAMTGVQLYALALISCFLQSEDSRY